MNFQLHVSSGKIANRVANRLPLFCEMAWKSGRTAEIFNLDAYVTNEKYT